MTRSKLLIEILKYGLLALALFFVYREFVARWGELQHFDWHIDFVYLMLSIGMHLVTFLLFSKVWSILILRMGHRVSLVQAFRLAYISNLTRYLPGKFWPVFGMTYLAKTLGIRESVAVASWAIALMYTIPSSFATALVVAQFSVHDMMGVAFANRDTYWVVVAVVAVASAVLLFLPNLSIAVFNRLLRLIRRPMIECSIDRPTAFIVYFGYSICWLAYGVAFWLLTTATVSGVSVSVVDCVSAFVLAYQIGYLAFFAPGGFGVRELVLTHLMDLSIGSAAIGVAVICRVWNLTVELLAAAIAAFTVRRRVDTDQ